MRLPQGASKSLVEHIVDNRGTHRTQFPVRKVRAGEAEPNLRTPQAKRDLVNERSEASRAIESADA
jgi:hypothetical protein